MIFNAHHTAIYIFNAVLVIGLLASSARMKVLQSMTNKINFMYTRVSVCVWMVYTVYSPSYMLNRNEYAALVWKSESENEHMNHDIDDGIQWNRKEKKADKCWNHMLNLIVNMVCRSVF